MCALMPNDDGTLLRVSVKGSSAQLLSLQLSLQLSSLFLTTLERARLEKNTYLPLLIYDICISINNRLPSHMFSYQHARDPKFNIWSELLRSSEALFTFAFYPFSIVSRFEIKLQENSYMHVTRQKKRSSAGETWSEGEIRKPSKAFLYSTSK